MPRTAPWGGEPCYSVRLLQPFLRLLRDDPRLPSTAFAALPSAPEARVPARVVAQLMAAVYARIDDPDLGLKAALLVDMGDHDVLEYAAGSADTWGEALEVVLRYIRLLNGAADFSLRIEGELAVLELSSHVALGRGGVDFQCGAIIVGCRHWLGQVPPGEVWFPYPRPASTALHERVFPGASLRFDAPYSAFRFARTLLDTKLATANPKLHTVLRRQAERMLAELPRAQTFKEQVGAILMEQLASGNVTATSVGRRLSISRRTLIRRLELEGTTFKALLESARRRVAENHLASTELTIQELAFLLGYSETAAFSRAFKRWTSHSPAEYRERTRRTANGAS